MTAQNTADLPTDALIDLYRRMLLIRIFEEQAIELFAKGLITGTTHPYIGQEAIAVGVCAALKKEDQILATYRGHGAAQPRWPEKAEGMYFATGNEER